MANRKRLVWLVVLLLLVGLYPAQGSYAIESEAPFNLAQGQPASRSSDCSCGRVAAAVDGDPATYWQPLSSDRSDGEVWLSVDLGLSYDIGSVKLNVRSGSVSSYAILTSNDGSGWQEAASRTVSAPIAGTIDTISFQAIPSRYVKVSFNLSNTNFQLNELEVYSSSGNPPPSVLDSVYVTDSSGFIFGEYGTVSLGKGDSLQLIAGGAMSDGSAADLSEATVDWSSSDASVAAVDAQGNVSALSEGVAKIHVRVSHEGAAKEAHAWIDVYDTDILLVDSELVHPGIVQDIGSPAYLSEGDSFPSIRLLPHTSGYVSGSLALEGSGAELIILPPQQLAANQETLLSFPGTAEQQGIYEIQLTFHLNDKPPLYDAYYFTVKDAAIGADQSEVAYLGDDGNMVYVPDYKGNRIIDFSNAGYMGGGVRLPDVQAKVAVEPGAGDDTQRIQDAIDLVSAMPQNAQGIRGAVLLEQGTFEIAGTLQINASGVIIRGQGQGEDGTILHATGTESRNILEIAGDAPYLFEDTRAAIADMYVPSGARSFRVSDSSGYEVGDTILVGRVGNARWIHAIDMDTIYEAREGTVQWSPFNLEFDRVITAIDGNVVTIDAPVANAIERRWGGGYIIQYDDSGRLDQVGVENLRVDSSFDPSVTATTSYNGETITYYSDENHARSFIATNYTKNTWVRNITALHLQYALVSVGRGSKWTTIQDNETLDMVSVLTGGRRYSYDVNGQLTLVQRSYAETARHAFVLGSRIPGPNVFLQNESQMDFGSSEPHHRWSVGGLYDSVKAQIAIQDRGWLGSGHGWSGANYVTWNTEGGLVNQKPPTATSYSIGHIGPIRTPYLPKPEDNRYRAQAYWESYGSHVNPHSLYLQQLEERLGEQAVQNIQSTPVGGSELDMPATEHRLPLLKGIKVNNKHMEGFVPTTFDYTLELEPGSTELPHIRPHDHRHRVEIIPATSVYGMTVLMVTDKRNADKSVRYNIRFVHSDGTANEN